MSMLGFIIGFVIGGMVGVMMMCLCQINRSNHEE